MDCKRTSKELQSGTRKGKGRKCFHRENAVCLRQKREIDTICHRVEAKRKGRQ